MNTAWDTPSDSHWLPPDLEFKYILRMVYCLFFSNLFLNIDMGILPAGSLDIKEEVGLNNTWFGTLGSAVYLGQMVGSLAATYFFKKFQPKSVLMGCLSINIVSLILFTSTDNFFLLCICRLGTGIF